MITKLIYPRLGSKLTERDRLSAIEIPPYAEEMRILPGWVMDGALYEPAQPSDTGSVRSFWNYLAQSGMPVNIEDVFLWSFNFYSNAGWQNGGLTSLPIWRPQIVAAVEKEWVPIPVTCRAVTISMAISPMYLAASGESDEMIYAMQQYYFSSNEIMIEYRGIG